MFCYKCGKTLPDHSQFCSECGARMEDAPQYASAAVATGTLTPAYSDSKEMPGLYEKQPQQKTKSKAPLIILIVCGGCLLLALLAIACFWLIKSFVFDTKIETDPMEAEIATDWEQPFTVAPTAPIYGETEFWYEEEEPVTEPPATEEAPATTYNSYYSYPGDYIVEGSDSRYLTGADLRWMTKADAQMAINEIFARKGRLFKSAEIQAYFDSKSWYYGYISPEDFNESVFNSYEKYNLKFLAEYKDSLN